MTDEKSKQTAEEAIETGGTFADQVAGLSNEQLQVVKQTVLTEVGKREQPNYAGMSNNEFRETCRKKYGYSPV